MDKPEIIYPRSWAFKIIGREERQVLAAVEACLGGREYEFERSNLSSGGKYCSFSLLTVVESEEDRDRIFFSLRDDEGVRMVL